MVLYSGSGFLEDKTMGLYSENPCKLKALRVHVGQHLISNVIFTSFMITFLMFTFFNFPKIVVNLNIRLSVLWQFPQLTCVIQP